MVEWNGMEGTEWISVSHEWGCGDYVRTHSNEKCHRERQGGSEPYMVEQAEEQDGTSDVTDSLREKSRDA